MNPDDQDFSELPQVPHLEPLPRLFYSTETGDRFKTCLVCSVDLDTDKRPYVIQKSFRDGECIFEMAICLECGDHESQSWSLESKARVDEWLKNHPPTPAGPDVCCICAKQGCDGEEFAVYALSFAGSLVQNPGAICGACQGALDALLSAETRRALDEFNQRFFPGVPGGLERPVTILF